MKNRRAIAHSELDAALAASVERALQARALRALDPQQQELVTGGLNLGDPDITIGFLSKSDAPTL